MIAFIYMTLGLLALVFTYLAFVSSLWVLAPALIFWILLYWFNRWVKDPHATIERWF
jgi:hypothetical protein